MSSVATMLRQSAWSSAFHARMNLSLYLSTRRHATTSSNSHYKYDLAVVGGGIVGLATAREVLLRYPNLRVAVLEKEDKLAQHQSGHNSGVIHAGIYYPKGSLKARLCVEGLNLAYKYLDEKKIPYRKCGKLIVAVDKKELAGLDELFNRGTANGVRDLKVMGPEEMKEVEPHIKGLRGIFSPHTGVVDWGVVARHYGQDAKEMGCDIFLAHEVVDFSPIGTSAKISKDFSRGVVISVKDREPITARYVITCAGAYSDRLAVKSGGDREPAIVPMRGEYLLMSKEKHHLVKGLIYPVPDPSIPVLGVHFTPTIDGRVLLGPNAVLAFSREGYTYGDFNMRDVIDMFKNRGLHRLMFKHWRFGLQEVYRSIIMSAQLAELNKYIEPGLEAKDLARGPAGVRAQALDATGKLVDDFIFDEGSARGSLIHVRNAPSPAATSSLSIAKMIVDKATESFAFGQQQH
eukprot:Opistho-2@46424